jgi:hypothetical protein
MRIILAGGMAALAAFALAGCGGESAPAAQPERAPAANAAKGTRIANRPHEQMLALDDSMRRIALVRAIRSTGNRCPRRVEPNPVHQGEYEGLALWTARCDNNEQYAVFIAPNGDVQVRNCRDMAQLELPACRALPPAEPVRERPKAATKR